MASWSRKKECPVYKAGEGQTTLAILPGSVFDEKKEPCRLWRWIL